MYNSLPLGGEDSSAPTSDTTSTLGNPTDYAGFSQYLQNHTAIMPKSEGESYESCNK